MRSILLATLGLGLLACSGPGGSTGSDPGGATGGALQAAPLPIDVGCAFVPFVEAVDWNHPFKSPLVAFEEPHHRMIDLIAGAAAETQTVGGRIAYGVEDKSLEDELVQVFACSTGAWSSLGTAITDSEGRFTLTLSGASALPRGLRKLTTVVLGDRTSVDGIALVAGDGASVAVSDVDGTLTSSENAYPESLVTGAVVEPNDGAPAALTTLSQLGYPLVYVTSRGDRFTQDTRDWLADNGFPLGPVRLAQSLVTLPGDGTVAYKSGVFQGIVDGGLTVAIGIGNRASDEKAYASVAVAPSQTFLKLPEFASEVQPLIDARLAVGVPSYVTIQRTFAALPPAP